MRKIFKVILSYSSVFLVTYFISYIIVRHLIFMGNHSDYIEGQWNLINLFIGGFSCALLLSYHFVSALDKGVNKF